MSGNNPTANSLSGLQVPPPQVKVSFKNTFINVDDENSGELSMPDLLRAQTTPAVFNALQALYSGTQQQSTVSSGVAWSMEPVAEQESVLHESEQEEAPPQFTAEDVLRQLSELTETLSAMNHDGHSVERDTPLGDPNGDSTTVMLRNIPNKYTTDMLLDQFKEHGFSRLEFDFMYNPIDFKNQCNVGFCFVNFRHHDRAVKFIEAFENYRLPATNSNKICSVCWARIQGREANVAHYKDSPIAPEYRPWLFDQIGEREPFPEPDPEVLAAIEKSAQETVRAANATKGPDQNKIFIGGLDKETGGAELVSYFSRFGAVKDAAVVIDRTSGKSRGFGFCLFERFVPRQVLTQKHMIRGCEVAVKMYEGGSDNKTRVKVNSPQKPKSRNMW